MKKKNKVLSVVLAAVLTMAISGVAVAESAGVQIMEKPGIGSYLADSQGMTLYLFKKDSPDRSVCTGRCAENWPVFSHKPGDVTFGAGLKDRDFGSIKRDDGKVQLTYKRMPLYLFIGDTTSGDVNGQGMMGAWYVATP